MSASEQHPVHAAEPRRPADLRLLPVLAGLWAGVAAVLLQQPDSPMKLAVGTMVVLVGASGALGRWRRARGGALSGRPLAGVLLMSAALVGIALGALHVSRLSTGLTERIVTESAVVRLVGTVTGDPQAVESRLPDRAPDRRWTAEVRVHELRVRSDSYRTRLPVLVRGDQARALNYGSEVELTGRAEPPWNPERSAMTLRLLGPVTVRAPPGRVAAATNRVREAFRSAVAGLPPDAGALLLGLAVGDESTVTPDLDEAMVRSGLAHLTAVSGSNTSLVVGLALGAVTALGLGWRARVGSALLILGAYVLLVRPQPSVMRAAAMGLVGLVALTTGGRRRGPPALLAAAIVLLAWEPSFALSWGFALSVAATAGLLLIGPGIAERLAWWRVTARLPDAVRAALAVAVAAHLATLPLAVALGNGVSLVALPANVVVTPFVPIATVVGLAAAMAAPFLPGLGVALAWTAAPATALIAWVARHSAAVSFGVVSIPDGWRGALMLGVPLAGGWVLLLRGSRPWRDRRVVVLGVMLALVVGATARMTDARWPPPDWVVLACDVGQGDGLLVRSADSSTAVLVDVGPAGSGVADCARDAGITRLTVVLTHFHADHVDALAEVLRAFHVDAVLTSPTPDPLTTAQRVTRLAGDARVPLRPLRAGDRVAIAGVTLSVLWPARTMPDPNNASLVMVAELPTAARPVRALLTGDIEPPALAALLGRGLPLVDVVKVPHHGSSHQDPRLARATGADIALVSVGAGNDYGHPDAQTLTAYTAAGAVVGRTDTQGALAVVAGATGPRLMTARSGPKP
jgi:competence protein ComEC